MSYIELLNQNRKLASELNSPAFDISVYSNITLSPLKEILEFELRTKGLNGHVKIVNNINEPALFDYEHSAQAILLWFDLSYLIEGLWYKSETIAASDLAACIEKIKQDLNTLFKRFASHKSVCITLFSSLPFSSDSLFHDRYEELALNLNQYLRYYKPDNFQLINLDKILFNIGKERALTWSHFYRTKSLYSVSLFMAYAEQIAPYYLSIYGLRKKLLIVDCDFTLWGGIVGEEGVSGIQMTRESSTGQIYHEAQHILKTLKSRGVILAACSKNNPEDIDAALLHPGAILRKEDFAVTAINWQDKASNIKHILNSLNISADQAVFLDDNPFETELVKSSLPEIITLLVPKDRSDYPGFLREQSSLFFQDKPTIEDKHKTEQYQQAFIREQSKQNYDSIHDYLTSLDLSIKLTINERDSATRLAQLSQKTNQFNLTTLRQTETEIRNLINSGEHLIFGLQASDRFGDYGLTGCAIISLHDKKADIMNLMLSCRILGRNIEKAFMDSIMKKLMSLSVEQVSGRFCPTLKNHQVEKFYPEFGFKQISKTPAEQHFLLQISDYRPSNLDYIEIHQN